MYRLAVVVSKFAPATNGADALFSVNPCASLGLYPCAGSVSEIVLLLNPDGADGTALLAATGDVVLGYAREAGVDGQIIEIEMIQGGNVAA